jgi:ectoine hydroxylase-related dioxygenase (phytanoyl-CoA dioxygenase family)
LGISSTALLDIECKRGDIAFLHPKSIHGGEHNDSDQHRRLLVIQFGVVDEELATTNTEMFTGCSYQQMKEQSHA